MNIIDLPKELHLYILSYSVTTEVIKYRCLHSFFRTLIDQNQHLFFTETEIFVKQAYPICQAYHFIYHCSKGLRTSLFNNIDNYRSELKTIQSQYNQLLIKYFPNLPGCQKEIQKQKVIENRIALLDGKFKETNEQIEFFEKDYLHALDVIVQHLKPKFDATAKIVRFGASPEVIFDITIAKNISKKLLRELRERFRSMKDDTVFHLQPGFVAEISYITDMARVIND